MPVTMEMSKKIEGFWDPVEEKYLIPQALWDQYIENRHPDLARKEVTFKGYPVEVRHVDNRS